MLPVASCWKFELRSYPGTRSLILFIAFCVLWTWANVTISGSPRSNRKERLWSKRHLIYSANFSKPSLSEAFDGAFVGFGKKNVKVWKSGKGITVSYPAGSHVPRVRSNVGGFGISTNHPIGENLTAVLRYRVYFPENFNFVKGGKLPGLYGGQKDCTGGRVSDFCFSTRLMWRHQGEGELYLYANRKAQDPDICSNPRNHCSGTWGWSLNRGSFNFKRGAWMNLEQILRLNSPPGERNGVIVIKVDGVPVIRYDNLVFRTKEYPEVKIEGILFETFFGGNGHRWATPRKQTVKFKGLTLESFEHYHLPVIEEDLALPT